MASIQILEIPDNVKGKFEFYCKCFIELYELKLDAYTMVIEGNLDKSGKFADFVTEKIGENFGAAFAHSFLPAPTGVVGKISKELFALLKKPGQRYHARKVARVEDLLLNWKHDKAEFRKVLVDAALDVGQSFEMQLMTMVDKVDIDLRAIRLFALDCVNRSFDYYEKVEANIDEVSISKSVLQGASKMEPFLGILIPEFANRVKTPGFTIYSGKVEWNTSSLLEKSGVVIDAKSSNTYYRKIISRPSKYGYRRLLKSEKDQWSKLSAEYKEEPDPSNDFTEYEYKLSPDLDEFSNFQKAILDHANEKDPKLQEKRSKELLMDMEESILNQIKSSTNDMTFNHKSLEKCVTENNSNIRNHFAEILQQQRYLGGIFIEKQKETVSLLESANNDNKNEHAKTQSMLVACFESMLVANFEQPKKSLKDKIPIDIKCGSDEVDKIEQANTSSNRAVISANVNMVDARDVDGNTSLNRAVNSGDVDTAEVLIKGGANIEARDVDGNTPLNRAVNLGDVAMAEVLIKYGADVEARDVDYNTPLHRAVILGDIAMAKILIVRGAQREATDDDGNTPLNRAVILGDKAMAEVLMETKF